MFHESLPESNRLAAQAAQFRAQPRSGTAAAFARRRAGRHLFHGICRTTFCDGISCDGISGGGKPEVEASRASFDLAVAERSAS